MSDLVQHAAAYFLTALRTAASALRTAELSDAIPEREIETRYYAADSPQDARNERRPDDRTVDTGEREASRVRPTTRG